MVKNLVRFEYRVRADFLSIANFGIQCLIGDFLGADVLPTSAFREMLVRKSDSSCLLLSGNIQVQHTVTPKPDSAINNNKDIRNYSPIYT
jgi:hypothetical protein